MKKIGLLLVPMALALSACQNGEKQAGQLFQRAEAAYAAGEYSLAKLQIDSIRTLYPKAFEVRKAGIKLMQQIDLAEQTKTLAYLDSMMTVKQAALDSIKGKFVLERTRPIRKEEIISIPLRWSKKTSAVRSCVRR